MALDDALHRGQADAFACELVGGVQALEWPEQLAGLGLVEADAVVRDLEPTTPALPDALDHDPRRRSFPGEFPGVAKQVAQQVARQDAVPGRHHVRFDPHLRLAPRVTLRKL